MPEIKEPLDTLISFGFLNLLISFINLNAKMSIMQSFKKMHRNSKCILMVLLMELLINILLIDPKDHSESGIIN